MAKKKKTKRRRNGVRAFYHRTKNKKIPLAATMGILSTFMTPAADNVSILGHLMAGNYRRAMESIPEKFIGVDRDGAFVPQRLIATYTPVILGALISKFGGKLVNKYISNVPYIKL